MSTRTELEKDILTFIDDMDPSGKNSQRMKNLFKSFKSDTEFYRYMKKFFNNDDMNFAIAYEPLDNPVNSDFIHNLSKKYKIPLYEIVYKPYLNNDIDNPPATVYKMLVMDYPVKRLKQMVFKKNHTSISANKRDAKTGQVTGSDKTARITDVETYSLLVQEQYNAAREYYGPMSDDTSASYEMARIIQRDGEVSLNDLPNDPLNKVTLNTINYFMLGAGLSTNLIERTGYVLPITLKNQEERTSTIKRGGE